VADVIVGDVGLEVVPNGRDGGRRPGHVVGDELGELLFQQSSLLLKRGIRPNTFSRISRSVMRRSTAAARRSLSRL